MAYRIRYKTPKEGLKNRGLLIQTAGAVVLGMGMWLAGGLELLRPSQTPLEQATAAMAAALADGAGWYAGLLQFCGRILHGAH